MLNLYKVECIIDSFKVGILYERLKGIINSIYTYWQ